MPHDALAQEQPAGDSARRISPLLRQRARIARLVLIGLVIPIALLSNLLPTLSDRQAGRGVATFLIWLFLVTSIYWLHERGGRAPWNWFAAGLGISAIGSIVSAVHPGDPAAFMTPADLIWVIAFMCTIIGSNVLLHTRGIVPETRGLIDVGILVAAVYAFPGIILTQRVVHGIGVDQAPRPIALLFLILDVGMLVPLVWILTSRAVSMPVMRYLALGMVLQFAGDILYSMGSTGAGDLIETCYVLAPLMTTLAAGHVTPMLRELRSTHTRRDVDRPWIILMATSAALALTGVVLSLTSGGQQSVLGAVLALVIVVVLGFSRVMLMVRGIRNRLDDLNVLAFTDELTRLPNRRAILGALEEAVAAVRHPITVAILDIDHFKRFNDTYGHDGGDDLLVAASAQWRQSLGSSGAIGRLGGEEFLVVLPEHDTEQAKLVLARMRHVMPMEQSFSAGSAQVRPGEDTARLLKRADEALYQAKQTGRGRTVTAAA